MAGTTDRRSSINIFVACVRSDNRSKALEKSEISFSSAQSLLIGPTGYHSIYRVRPYKKNCLVSSLIRLITS